MVITASSVFVARFSLTPCQDFDIFRGLHLCTRQIPVNRPLNSSGRDRFAVHSSEQHQELYRGATRYDLGAICTAALRIRDCDTPHLSGLCGREQRNGAGIFLGPLLLKGSPKEVTRSPSTVFRLSGCTDVQQGTIFARGASASSRFRAWCIRPRRRPREWTLRVRNKFGFTIVSRSFSAYFSPARQAGPHADPL